MADALVITTEAASPQTDVDFVRDMLFRFNTAASQEDRHTLLNVFARDTDGKVHAGLLGGTYWGWLHVDILWVQSDLRSKGLGSRLLEAAEAEAIARGCRHAHLDTLDFQAPGFYLKRGYQVFGELQDLPPGHRRIFLKKELV